MEIFTMATMTYEEMHDKMIPVSEEMQKTYKKLCQRNGWLMDGGIPFEDDPCLELDSSYSIIEFKDSEALETFFEHGNWSIRQGVLYHDLIFANQVNGGDEWWTCKRFGSEWVPFESISFRFIIKDGKFTEFIERLDKATRFECEHLQY